MSPVIKNTVVNIWTCCRCKKTDEVPAPETNSRDFMYRATIVLESVGRDYQGGIVGPGPRKRGDLCDKCFNELFIFLNEGHK